MNVEEIKTSLRSWKGWAELAAYFEAGGTASGLLLALAQLPDGEAETRRSFVVGWVSEVVRKLDLLSLAAGVSAYTLCAEIGRPEALGTVLQRRFQERRFNPEAVCYAAFREALIKNQVDWGLCPWWYGMAAGHPSSLAVLPGNPLDGLRGLIHMRPYSPNQRSTASTMSGYLGELFPRVLAFLDSQPEKEILLGRALVEGLGVHQEHLGRDIDKLTDDFLPPWAQAVCADIRHTVHDY